MLDPDKGKGVRNMGNVETANTLTLVGAILSLVFGTIYLLAGVALAILGGIFAGLPFMILGILSTIFGVLLLMIARKSLLSGDLKTGAIYCFIFGGISSAAIGGILAIVAGILAMIAWDQERKAAEAPPSPPPSAPQAAGAVIYCQYCGARLSPEVVFCSSCGKKIKS